MMMNHIDIKQDLYLCRDVYRWNARRDWKIKREIHRTFLWEMTTIFEQRNRFTPIFINNRIVRANGWMARSEPKMGDPIFQFWWVVAYRPWAESFWNGAEMVSIVVRRRRRLDRDWFSNFDRKPESEQGRDSMCAVRDFGSRVCAPNRFELAIIEFELGVNYSAHYG